MMPGRRALIRGLGVLLLGVSSGSFGLETEAAERRWGGLDEQELISIGEVYHKQLRGDKFLLLDVRTERSFNEGHIPGAEQVLTPSYYAQEEQFRQGKLQEMGDRDLALAERMKPYAKETEMVLYCNDDCQSSAVYLYRIKKLGFFNVRAMRPGLQSWQAQGYPVTQALNPASKECETCA